MKKNIHKKIFETLKSKGVLAVSTALLMMSCAIQPGTYSETDGVYYDPNRDTLPQGVDMYGGGNRVGQYYDYQNTEYVEPTQQEIVYDRYKNWGSNSDEIQTVSSDWGSYAGSETNYYDWGWNYYPYGMYSGFGWGWGGGFGFGWNSWGWGSQWGWYGYNPYWYGSWGYPWGWYGGYNPYWYGYNPYWYGGYGYNYPRNSYNAPGFINRRSGSSVGFGRNSYSGGFRPSGSRIGSNANNGFRPSGNINNGGFRPNGNGTRVGNQNQGNINNGGRVRTNPQPRYNDTRTYTPSNNQPIYNQQNNSGGFRSNSNSSGGFRSGGSGGFGGSSGSSGGGRSGGGGGFRR